MCLESRIHVLKKWVQSRIERSNELEAESDGQIGVAEQIQRVDQARSPEIA